MCVMEILASETSYGMMKLGDGEYMNSVSMRG